MANWSLPTITDLYTNFLAYLKARDDDATRLNDSRVTAATNVPDYAKRWNDTTKTFQNWLSSAWTSITLAIAGGGTGATTAAGARTNLDVYSRAEADAAFVTTLTTAEGESSGVTLTTDNTYYSATSMSLVAGTWLVVGSVGVRLDAANQHRIYTRILVGATAYGENVLQTVPYVTGAFYISIPAMDIITVGSTTTVYLQAKRSGGLATDYVATATYGTYIRAVKIA